MLATLLTLLSRQSNAEVSPEPAICPITVVPSEAADWQHAARNAEKRPEIAGQDCIRVLLVVTNGRAQMTFVTRDGRQAERELSVPSELEPTLAALSEAGIPAKPETDTRQSKGNSHSAPQLPETQAAAEASSSAASERAMYGFTLGIRAGHDSNYWLVSPMLGIHATLGLGPWLLGVIGRYEPGYRRIIETSSGQKSKQDLGVSAVAAGVTVGRRMALSNLLAIDIHTDVLFAAVHEERAQAQDTGSNNRAELRLGPRVGLVLPRRSHTRFLPQLSFEFSSSSGTTSTTSADIGQKILPSWAFGLALGIELGEP